MKILKINSSAAQDTSVSRKHVEAIVTKLKATHANSEVTERDLSYENLPFPTAEYLGAVFSKEELTPAQKELTKISDTLVQELLDHDIFVIGAPMYNFTVPGSLKAYFDLIARAGKTFKYGDDGSPVGLVQGKKAIVVITSGGVPLGSPMDFSKPYITLFLGFLGIQDVEFVELDQLMFKADEKLAAAAQAIETLATT